MATKKNTDATETTEATVTETVTASTEKKFTVEKLGQYSRKLFGVSSTTYAGATAGLDGTYTIEEMKAIIDSWKNTKIKKEAN